MVYFVLVFRVLLIWTILIAPANLNNIQGEAPTFGIISSFLQQFIKPYIDQINVNGGKSLLRTSGKAETKIEKFIRSKVAALQPLLQDIDDKPRPNNITGDNLTLEGNDETTIIEFVPKPKPKKGKGKMSFRAQPETDSFQTNINKYKQLKETIERRLDKEKTRSSTKKLIIRTLDEMIAQLIERQCTWKNVDTKVIKNHLFKDKPDIRKSMNKLQKLSNEDWMSLRKQFLNFLHLRESNEDDFMKQFHDFFSSVINDTWNLSHRYKVRCQLVKESDTNKGLKQFLREDKMVEKNQCDSFKVCADELNDFLVKFYNYLNDTAVSTFRNYAAMYIRDVNADIDLDKDIVVSVIDNLSNTAERKVGKIFKRKLSNFTLDENKKKGANIQHINDFITATINQVQKVLQKNVDYELSAMKTKLFSTVKADLSVNLRSDLDNLSKLFTDRICTLFTLCNSKYPARRYDSPWTSRSKDSSDNIYVKVQLSFDDEMKDAISRYGVYPKPWQDMTHRFLKRLGVEDQRRYGKMSVTRTTMATTTDNTTVVNITPSTINDTITPDGINLIVNNNI